MGAIQLPKITPGQPVDELLNRAQEVKQDYSADLKDAGIYTEESEEPKKPASDGAESGGAGSGSGGPAAAAPDPGGDTQEDSAFDPDDEARYERNMQAMVGIFDLGVGVWGSYRSLEGDIEKFRAQENQRKTIAKELGIYLKDLGVDLSLPSWINLITAVVLVYSPVFIKIEKVRKMNLKTQKKQSDTVGKEEVQTKEERDKKKEQQPSSSSQVYDEKGEAIGDYWKALGKENPVSEKENKKRLLDGGQLCENCGVNHCNKGKKTCSSHCAGKRTQSMK